MEQTTRVILTVAIFDKFFSKTFSFAVPPSSTMHRRAQARCDTHPLSPSTTQNNELQPKHTAVLKKRERALLEGIIDAEQQNWYAATTLGILGRVAISNALVFRFLQARPYGTPHAYARCDTPPPPGRRQTGKSCSNNETKRQKKTGRKPSTECGTKQGRLLAAPRKQPSEDKQLW